MYEALPLLAGALIGFVAMQLKPRMRIPFTVILAILAGVSATMLSGEAAESWLFVIWDTFLVLAAAGGMSALLIWLERRSNRLV